MRLLGSRGGVVRTDQVVSVGSYYNRKLFLDVSEQTLQQLTDRTLFASTSPAAFRITKAPTDLRALSYYFIHCVGINRNVEATPLSFARSLQRREYRF